LRPTEGNPHHPHNVRHSPLLRPLASFDPTIALLARLLYNYQPCFTPAFTAHRLSAGSSTTRIRRRPDPYRDTTLSPTPLDNYSDTLCYDRGADRTGTVSQRLSGFLEPPAKPAGPTTFGPLDRRHTRHISHSSSTTLLSGMKGRIRGREQTPLWPAGTAIHPALLLLHFPNSLGTSLSLSGSKFFCSSDTMCV
jgi:hypothetical protein